MGIPVATRNIFPSNIEGLPTWFEVRVSERGYAGRREGIDIMVAMNAETFEEDIASIVPGGHLVYDNSKELNVDLRRDDINLVGIPISQLVLPEFPNPKHRALFKNIVYLGALSALINIDFEVITGMVSTQYKGKGRPHRAEHPRLGDRPQLRARLSRRGAADPGALLHRGRRQDSRRRQHRRGNRRDLRRRHGVRLVSDHPVDIAGRSLRAVLQPVARRRERPAQLRHHPGGRRTGRHGDRHRCRLERRPGVHGHQRPGAVADDRVPRAGVFRGDSRGALGHPARRSLHRDADAHPTGRPARRGLRLPRRHAASAAVSLSPPTSASTSRSRRWIWPIGCRRRSW